jgi:type I restriction-modification system DNA methylase subunit/restriction endonuclease S subunit
MARSTVHYADSDTNNTLKKLHNKLRPAGTPVQRVEYIIELLLLRIFEVKLKQDQEFKQLRDVFKEPNDELLFSCLYSVANEQLLSTLNEQFFPFYAGILSHARKIYKEKNLSQKVLDQLVLIEEVFKNSNFTNNVKSGNLQEIISLVSEISEDRLLKTDLLGDAIESALSETGGTKDIGLHRTPDHIRQFMAGIAAPSFIDSIYDPTCGTAGFLFDSWGYGTEAIRRDGTWPGTKAHPEISEYFEKYFYAKDTSMPTTEQAITFYRSGISGTEYLGVIRKMAAINLYIRGLNPSTIVQGDSLALFNVAEHGNTKTIILANPPFGAQRDQEAYSNIWEEYPREAETTLLFVKLMLDTLADNGICAVVVSEGFLSWDQASARTLRKMLLDEARLKAVISLPQGVFVSKSGVGPKTSILVFEKGGRTDNVWFYKVTNDGYTMGTNRQVQKGCQLVAALKLYESHIRKGQIPPETNHSFTIPAEWIRVLDPRIKKRIEQDTHKELSAKAAVAKRKLEKKIKKQLKDGKIDKREFNSKLAQHDEIWQSKTLNEIAKRIEKAHLFSFNLGNFRSSLSIQQIDRWNSFFPDDKNHNSQLNLDEKFSRLQKCDPEQAHDTLAYFDIQNGLEFDIIRQYLDNFSAEELENFNQLAELQRILESGTKYPRVRLGKYLVKNTDKIKPQNFPETRFRVLGVSNTEGIFLNETKFGKEIQQANHQVKPKEFCYNPYRVNVGSIGLNEFDYDNQIISGAYNVFGTDETELLPEYLMALFRSPQFLEYVNDKAHGGVRMNFKYDFLEDWEIPLPSINEQHSIFSKIKDAGLFAEYSRKAFASWRPQISETEDKRALGEFILDSLYGLSSKLQDKGQVPVIRMNNLDDRGFWYLKDLKYTDIDLPDTRFLQKDDFLFNRTNSIDLVGKSSVVDFDTKMSWAGYLIRLQLSPELNPYYLKYLFSSPKYKQVFKKIAKPAGGQANINVDELSAVTIDYRPIEEQNAIVEQIDRETENLRFILAMAQVREQDIKVVINNIWNE